MVSLLVLMFICFAASDLSAAGGQSSETPNTEIDRGVVVEKVAPHSEGKKAGLQEGDILLTWSRDDSKSEIQSPFDFAAIESESLVSSVILEGRRGTEKRVWFLRFGNWGLVTRPNFSGHSLSSYRAGEELAKTDMAAQVLEAAELWKYLANRSCGPETLWSAVWLFVEAAGLLQQAHHWKDADDAYQSADNCRQRSATKIENSENAKLATAANLSGLAMEFYRRGNVRAAEQYYRQALAIQEKVAPSSLAVAKTLMGLGNIATLRENLEEGGEYYYKALSIRRKLAPGSLAVAASLGGLGMVSLRQRDLTVAAQYYREALDIQEKVKPGSRDMIENLKSLGLVAWQVDDYAKAQRYYIKALNLNQRLASGSLDLAENFTSLGHLAYDRGDLAAAEKYYCKAIAIEEKLEQGDIQAANSLGRQLLEIAALERERGNLVKAEQYFRELNKMEIMQTLPSPGSLEMAEHLDNAARIAYEKGELGKAESYYGRAVAIIEKLKPSGTNIPAKLSVLLDLVEEKGDFTKATERYRRETQELRPREALATSGITKESSSQNGVPDGIWGIRLSFSSPTKLIHSYDQIWATAEKMDVAEFESALASLGVGANDTEPGELDLAAKMYAQAVRDIEWLTGRIGGPEAVRFGFRANYSHIYAEYIELLLKLKRFDQAFEVLERSRARVLLEMLATAHVDIHKGADPLVLEQERSLQGALATKADQGLRLLGKANKESELAALAQAIEDLSRQYQDVEQRLRINSPAYASLTQPQPLTASQIQQLLDADTVLLEYGLGEKRSYAFVVTASSVNVYELPKQAEIESTAKTVYGLLSSRSRTTPGETRSQRQSRERKAEAGYAEAEDKLSGMVLAPLAEQIKGKRLLIVGDGALQYTPFAALPSPEPSLGHRAPLIAEHEIVNLPSASILSVLRREASTRKSASKAVMILADPVFDSQDDRLRRAGKAVEVSVYSSDTKSDVSLDRSAREVGAARDGFFPRLPFTRREAEAIYATAAPGDATKALDFDASKATATSKELGNYRIVHLATHGLVNSEHPAFSGLVFSLFDRQGRQQDGFLRLSDIYNLELNADLVVLSACQTALGKQINGEGLIGITRGFMYAGSPRVIASLWKVDDEATAELMKKFYEGVLKNGQRPAEALRAAQIWMSNQTRWQSPYYWAGFILQGEWK